MKIVFLQDDFPPESFGGAGISTYELAQGMKKAGHDVYIITTCRSKNDAGEAGFDGLHIFKIASNYHQRWRAYRSVWNIPVTHQVKKILKKVRPDVVHINNVHMHLSFHCFLLARKYARTVVFTARDTMSVCYGKLATQNYLESYNPTVTFIDNVKQARWRYNPLYTLIVRWYISLAHVRTSVSDALRDALQKNGIQNVVTVHTGMDVTQWHVSLEALQEFTKKFNLQGKKVVLHNGRLSEGKGSDSLFVALKKIVKSVPDMVLLVVGQESDYGTKIDGELISESVIFTGWADRKTVMVSFVAADVVVVPSMYLDPFPRVVLEAMVSKKPVVGSCYGGSPEAIIDGVTGFVVNPRNPEEIATRTTDLLTDLEKAKRFGEAGFARIKAEFTEEHMVKKYTALYEAHTDVVK